MECRFISFPEVPSYTDLHGIEEKEHHEQGYGGPEWQAHGLQRVQSLDAARRRGGGRRG